MKKRRCIACINTVLFIGILSTLSLLGLVNLVDFYVNDVVDYNEWTSDMGNKFETDEATCFFGKFQFINLNGAIRKILGQHEMNDVVKLNNGYLCTPMMQTSDDTLKDYCNSVKEIKDYFEKEGIELLYVNPPYSVSKYDNQLPEGIEDFGNDNADRFLQMLKVEGINILDLRQTMYDDGIDQYEYMYKTDHHWTTQAGFYTYNKISDYIVNLFQCDYDNRVNNLDNYIITKYPKWHLGSYGQRTGIYFAGIDDFDLITPKFDVKLQKQNQQGSFEELVINKQPLMEKKYTSRYTYDYVLDNALDDYINLECENDIKVLLVSDSFAKAVSPYMILTFKEVRFLYDCSSAAVTKKYIDEYHPDIVILMYYTEYLQENSTTFDFRIVEEIE